MKGKGATSILTNFEFNIFFMFLFMLFITGYVVLI